MAGKSGISRIEELCNELELDEEAAICDLLRAFAKYDFISGLSARGDTVMRLEMNEIADEIDLEDAPRLTAEDLSLVTRRPEAEALLGEIEEHLRELTLCSGK